jgi:hypothetical protein
MTKTKEHRPGSGVVFDFGNSNLRIVSARPGATFSVQMCILFGARAAEISARSVSTGSGPGISGFVLRIFNFRTILIAKIKDTTYEMMH